MRPDLKIIQDEPLLMSLLYDLDLLPEQLKQSSKEWQIMLNIVEHWRARFEKEKK